MKKLAVVLMSGGMDSALCAAIALKDGYEVAALHLNYQHRTQAREERAFNDICDFYGIARRLVVDVGYFKQIGGSSLTDLQIDVPKAKFDKNEIRNTYVPFRNGNIMAIGASWAETLGAEALFIGAVEQDSSGYPDCRAEFFRAFEKALNYGTKPETNIKIVTPIILLSKKEIVQQAILLNVPLYLTWSCYVNEDAACGECESCLLRLRGFEQAGYIDPIRYVNKANE
ncbi:MAG TPA: 7-cyano-7-deazaguanine synthase QueC [Candidatus Kapabacteria bacterium]|jgi:7-cyano-7-deazaguanine synthase|nr:7-cyano-7-deazaguanine synthase QueC [Candidatus Kapabacteria bacterium]HOM04315.1 7-cyano-7-deazaguanine synthase QueC [Candidatus Kapabacteria bacterium]HPU23592.1 7-cyano-7-deazaguanine synthase QueC [Candidatus Kapabacteria bacterium]